MAIEIFSISENQRNQILHKEESHFCDMKAIEVSPAKLSRAIAAFANADGGELYIGISENKETSTRSWIGFQTIEAANGHIQPFEQHFPLGTDFEYSFLSCDGENGLVLQASIRKTPDIKHATDGKVYLRRGAQNLPIENTEALRRLEYTKGLASFENEVVDAPVEIIENSIPALEFILGVIPRAIALAKSPVEW